MMTINQVSKYFNITARTLRYYEEIGLITSIRSDEYAYRMYEDGTIQKLQQIIVLRKLTIPLKDIKSILKNADLSLVIQIFQKRIDESNNEISALSTIRSILNELLHRIQTENGTLISIEMFNDDTVKDIMDSLLIVKNNFKEDLMMEKLKEADKPFSQLKDVRIIYVPSFTVAAIHMFDGELEAEHYSSLASNEFVKYNNLVNMKPDFRHFGFNHDCGDVHGYEEWITIPKEMEVEHPYEKKYFDGGLYAAHLIPEDGSFDDWQLLYDWVENSEIYEIDEREPLGMGGWVEEHFDNLYLLGLSDNTQQRLQIDLLMPVKQRNTNSIKSEKTYLNNSETICGYKAFLENKESFYVTGITKMITPENSDVNNFWVEAKQTGSLNRLLKLSGNNTLLGCSSLDKECRKYPKGTYRYTICIEGNLSEPNLYSFKISTSKWICFEMTKEKFLNDFWRDNPHFIVQKLGYKFNSGLSLHFDVFMNSNTRILDSEDIDDRQSIVCFWMPIK